MDLAKIGKQQNHTMLMISVKYEHERWVTDVKLAGYQFVRRIYNTSKIIPGGVINPPEWYYLKGNFMERIQKYECGILEGYYYRDIVPKHGERAHIEIVREI